MHPLRHLNGQGGVHLINSNMPQGISSMYKYYATSIFAKTLIQFKNPLTDQSCYELNELNDVEDFDEASD